MRAAANFTAKKRTKQVALSELIIYFASLNEML